jgi:hypothetical protein
MRIALAIFSTAMCATLVLGCRDTRDDAPPVAGATALTAHTTQRAAFEIVGADTLSDSARILRLLPEADGDGIVALFAEPARGVSAGLGIIDRRMAHPQLLWPDSVTDVWWVSSHTLAFTTTTGQGIRLVADVHAATLKIADTSDTRVGPPASAVSVDSAVARRARAYIDSVHVQPGGTTTTSALAYSVSRLVPSPDGTLIAFHVQARDPSGVLTNPAWYILDRSSGVATPLDRVTGVASELPSEAGAWSTNASFFYAKGRTVWEAEIQRTTSSPSR